MKRTTTSPTGLSPMDKERRGSNAGSIVSDITIVREGLPLGSPLGSPSQSKSYADMVKSPTKSPIKMTQQAASVRSGVSTSTSRRELNRDFSFVKEKPSGPWRDLITVDIWSIDGQDYKGTVRPKEARDQIYQGALSLQRDNLHGMEFEFRGHPVITFRLKTQVNIDLQFESEIFSYERLDKDGPKVIQGKIRGIRLQTPNPDFYRGEGRRVKIKNCKWSLKEEEIEKWMESYGKVLVPITEETHDMQDSDPDLDEDPIGTGNYWLTMRLDKPIPQFIPMLGRKIEIYYRGMKQVCVNCYEAGHKKNDCKNQRREWVNYVAEFIETNDLSPEMYGKWFEITKKLRTSTDQAEGHPASNHDLQLEPEVILREVSDDRATSNNEGDQLHARKQDPSKESSQGLEQTLGTESDQKDGGPSGRITRSFKPQTSDPGQIRNRSFSNPSSVDARGKQEIAQGYRKSAAYKKNTDKNTYK